MIDSPAVRSFGLTSGLRAGLATLFILPALGCFAVGTSFDPPELIPMALGAAFLVACGVFWHLTGKTELFIDSEGIWRTSPFGSQGLGWEEIAEYQYQEIPDQYGKAAGGLIGAVIQAAYEAKTGKRSRALQLTLNGPDGRQIKVTSSYKDAEEAISAILDKLHARMKPVVRQQIADYGMVVFGPLILSRDGLSCDGKDPIPWAEVARAEITGRRLRIRRKGKMFDSVSVAQQSVPNLLLALELIEAFRNNVGMASVVEAFA